MSNTTLQGWGRGTWGQGPWNEEIDVVVTGVQGTTALGTPDGIPGVNVAATGGGTLTKVAPTTSGTTAFTDFADLSFTTATITAMGALIYNDTNSDKAVCVLDFTSNKTSTSGTFTIQFPTADASNAIIRIA